ncbi:MAG: cell division FtsK/SpoIIIE [Parcubacteria group bacterium GW2011_GWA2_47_26]|nr:MAG: cell division FtsK/SpoIIIE [Parcubacteria group bacterium GW2011_GWA2_47_26]
MSRKRRGPRLEKKIQLPQQTRREIGMIFLFTLAGLALLAYFNLAGRAGLFIDSALSGLLGTLRPLLPLLLIAIGGLLAKSPPRSLALLGLIIFSISLVSLTHLIQYPGGAGFTAVEQGLGGGYLGLFIAYPLYQLFGFWATAVILVALLFIALSLLASASFIQLLHALKQLLRYCMAIGIPLRNIFAKPRISGEYDEKPAEQELRFEEHPLDAASKEDAADTAQSPETLAGDESDPSAALASGLKILPRKRLGRIELPLDLLEKNGSKPVSGNIRARQEIIEKTLRNFGIAVEMGDVSVGPTVTQYTLRPAEGVKLASITALSNDLALALAAHPIRIEAPIPGKALVGIEVPNEQISTVRLREILESSEWQKRASPLTVILGKDVSGKPYISDLGRMPHLLVAGSTGSGKTVCLNTIIVSLLYQNSPDDLKLLLIDPKRVELPSYNEIPHLISPVITDVKQTVQALRFALIEMERRFGLLSTAGARDLKSYNEIKPTEERLPYLIIVVDELADLMVAAASEVEAAIIRLAQMARAVGIHLILATQRPSVDVITGLIKANITSRIAFSVASLIDSRTILDTAGAEKLLGRGDMLFISSELGKPKRLQGAYVSDQEIRKVVGYLRKVGAPEYVEITAQTSASIFNGAGATDDDSDPLLAEAKEIILQAGKASASLLQRRLKIGYARAARILDLLEAAGFIGPGDGAKPREILVSHEQS